MQNKKENQDILKNNRIKIYDFITEDSVSLPKEIDKRRDILKEEYLSWVYSFGECEKNSKKIREYVKSDGLELWWLTLIAEKSHFKTPEIYTLFKLRTIELLCKEQKVLELQITTDDEKLKKPMNSWAKEKGVKIIWIDSNEKKVSNGVLIDKLPQLLSAILWLGWLWLKKIRKTKKDNKIKDAKATIVTYFPNIDMELAEKGIFKSNYWMGLHELIKSMDITLNWIFIYVNSKQCTYSEMLKMKEKFNLNSNGNFFVFEEFIDIRIIIESLVEYLKLYLGGREIQDKKNFRLPNSEINFYYVYEKSWKKSVIGRVLLENIIWIKTFRKIFKNLKNQKFCLYPCEMISWEKALVFACFKANIPTIAFQHTSLRPMDIRYFNDSRVYESYSGKALLPTILAVNGEWAHKQFIDNNYPKERIFLVESLRNIYLLELEKTNELHKKTLIVLPGIKKDENELQISLIKRVIDKINFERIWIKPHPYFPINDLVKKYGLDKKIEIRYENIKELFRESDVAFTSNEGTVCIESSYIGIPTICMPSNGINLSPLLGKNIPFAFSTEELSNFLNKPKRTEVGSEIFLLDRSLKNWKKLLEKFIQT